jgi:hypothetical protein
MKKSIKVALNMSKLSVAEKITKARTVVDAMTVNILLYPNPIPALLTITNATNALESAWIAASDGGKTKTAVMHEKETVLMKYMSDLSNYVERIAGNSTELIVTAGFDVKKPGIVHFDEFQVERSEDHGAIFARVKPRRQTVYRWEVCKDPISESGWVVAKQTIKASTPIQDLEIGVKYWVRVVFVGKDGNTIAYEPISIIVC